MQSDTHSREQSPHGNLIFRPRREVNVFVGPGLSSRSPERRRRERINNLDLLDDFVRRGVDNLKLLVLKWEHAKTEVRFRDRQLLMTTVVG